MATVSTLTFDLVANSASLVGDLRKAGGSVESWAGKTRSAANVAGKALAGAGVTGTAALTAIYVQSSKTIDRLGKFSDQIGEVPDKIQGLRRAADLTGESSEALDGALEKMVKRLGDASRGSGEAAKWINELGLNTSEFFSLSPADQFGVIGDKINTLSTQQEKAAASAAFFSRSGLGLVNTVALGSEKLQEITQEVKDYGLSLSRVDIAKIEAANDSWFRAAEVTDGFGNQLSVKVAPLVEALSNQFLGAAKEAGGLGEVASQVVNVIVEGVGYAANSVRGLQVAWGGVKLLVAGAVSTIVSGMVEADKAVTAFLNVLPGVEAKPSAFLQNLSDSLKQTYDDIGSDLESLLLEPIPSEKVKAWVADVTAKATESAAEVAANSAGNIGSTIAQGLITGDANGNESDSNLQEDFAAVQQTLMTEEQLLIDSYARRQATVAEFYAADAANQELAAQTAIALTEQMEAEITDIRARSAEEQAQNRQNVENRIQSMQAATVNMALGLAKSLTQGNEDAARAIIVVETALALARVAQNTAAAQMLALATIPPPGGQVEATRIGIIGGIQAGLVAAAGALNLSNAGGAANSSSFSGGSAASSYSGPTATPPINSAPALVESQPVEKVTQNIFYGDFNGLSEEYMEDFAYKLKEYQENSDFLMYESTSRQAREFVE